MGQATDLKTVRSEEGSSTTQIYHVRTFLFLHLASDMFRSLFLSLSLSHTHTHTHTHTHIFCNNVICMQKYLSYKTRIHAHLHTSKLYDHLFINKSASTDLVFLVWNHAADI